MLNPPLQSKIILFNGPPRSGKDYISSNLLRFLTENPPKDVEQWVCPLKFADPLKKALVTLMGIDLNQDFDLEGFIESRKEVRQDILGYKTLREGLIHLSEDCVKPFFGLDFFGKAAVRRMEALIQPSAKKPSRGVFVFSDSGFISETLPLIAEHGEENILVVQLRRLGSRFSGDSRRYIYPENVTILEYFNDRPEGSELFELIKNWIESDGRDFNLLYKQHLDRQNQLASVEGYHPSGITLHQHYRPRS